MKKKYLISIFILAAVLSTQTGCNLSQPTNVPSSTSVSTENTTTSATITTTTITTTQESTADTTTATVPTSTDETIVLPADGFDVIMITIPDGYSGYQLHSFSAVNGDPYHTSDGSVVLFAQNTDGAGRLLWINSRDGTLSGELAVDSAMVDPAMFGLEDGTNKSNIVHYGYPLGIRPKSYGYLIVLTGGFIAIDHDFQPIRTVRFADLPQFQWEWTNLGGVCGDFYDVSEDFRYLLSFSHNQYLIDLENGLEVLAQRHAMDRVIDLPGVGTLKVLNHILTEDNVMWTEARLNDRHGIFRYSISDRRYLFLNLNYSEDELRQCVLGGPDFPELWFRQADGTLLCINLSDGSSTALALDPSSQSIPNFTSAFLEDQNGNILILSYDRLNYFVDTKTGLVRTSGGNVLSVSSDGAVLVTDGERIYLLTPQA